MESEHVMAPLPRDRVWRNMLWVSFLAGVSTCVLGESLAWLFMLFWTEQDFGPIAGAPLFSHGSTMTIFLVSLFWAPLFETCIGQLAPIELMRALHYSARTGILFSAVVFAVGHAIGGGGIGQTLLTFICGISFAAVYSHFRIRGGPAFLAALLTHAVNNAAVLLLAFQNFPFFNQ